MSKIEILIIFCIVLGISNWYIYFQNINKEYKFDDNIMDKINKLIDKKKYNISNNQLKSETSLESSDNNIKSNLNNYSLTTTHLITNKPEQSYIINSSPINPVNKTIENNSIVHLTHPSIVNSSNTLQNVEQDNKEQDNKSNSINSRGSDIINIINYPNKEPTNIVDMLYNPIILDPINRIPKRDIDVVYNNFAPPYRRDELNYRFLNIPTRGYPDNYQLIGIVSRQNTESIYNLYGRQKYPGSNQYEYYIHGTFHNNNIKIPFNTYGDKEINDEQTIHIPGLDEDKGKFKVKLYKYDTLKYIP